MPRTGIRILLISLALLWVSMPAARAQPATLDAEIDRFIKAFSPTGLAVVVIEGGEIHSMRTHGLRRSDGPDPIGLTTSFTIASMGKAFVATALGVLVDEGRLGWDDPVVRHLPRFRGPDPYVTANLTIRDLLSHRSGLALGAGDLLTWPDGSATPSEAVAAVAHLPFGPFRDRFVYSNTMYRVAGAVIEAVSGRAWHTFVEERVLAPLGMNGCDVDPRQAARANLAIQHVRRAKGEAGTPLLDLAEHPDPAGGMVCTIVDLGKWARFQLSDGALPGETRLLTPETMSEIHKGLVPRRISGLQRRLAGANFGLYALGWEISDFHGRLLIEHGGQASGALSHIAIHPGRRAAVVALANDGLTPVSVLSYQILSRIASGEDAPDWIDDVAKKIPAALAEPVSSPGDDSVADRSVPPENWADYVAVYRDPWYGDIKVTGDAQGLRIHLTRSRLLEGPLVWMDGDRFVARWPTRGLNADATVDFERDASGSVMGMRLRAEREDTDFSYDYQNLRPVRSQD